MLSSGLDQNMPFDSLTEHIVFNSKYLFFCHYGLHNWHLMIIFCGNSHIAENYYLFCNRNTSYWEIQNEKKLKMIQVYTTLSSGKVLFFTINLYQNPNIQILSLFLLVEWALDLYVVSLSLWMLFMLKPMLSDIKIAIPAHFFFPFFWNILFHLSL